MTILERDKRIKLFSMAWKARAQSIYQSRIIYLINVVQDKISVFGGEYRNQTDQARIVQGSSGYSAHSPIIWY